MGVGCEEAYISTEKKHSCSSVAWLNWTQVSYHTSDLGMLPIVVRWPDLIFQLPVLFFSYESATPMTLLFRSATCVARKVGRWNQSLWVMYQDHNMNPPPSQRTVARTRERRRHQSSRENRLVSLKLSLNHHQQLHRLWGVGGAISTIMIDV